MKNKIIIVLVILLVVTNIVWIKERYDQTTPCKVYVAYNEKMTKLSLSSNEYAQEFIKHISYKSVNVTNIDCSKFENIT